MPIDRLDLQHFRTLESNLRTFENELISFRRLIEDNPNYSGQWIDHPQFNRTRKFYKIFRVLAETMLVKRRT